MKYTLRFLPAVEDDIITGYTWYEDKASGLGEDFIRMIYAGINNISRTPLFHPQVYGEYRRCLTRRFPYAIYYKIDEKKVIILGLFHCARDPQKINHHLSNRNFPENA